MWILCSFSRSTIAHTRRKKISQLRVIKSSTKRKLKTPRVSNFVPRLVFIIRFESRSISRARFKLKSEKITLAFPPHEDQDMRPRTTQFSRIHGCQSDGRRVMVVVVGTERMRMNVGRLFNVRFPDFRGNLPQFNAHA